MPFDHDRVNYTAQQPKKVEMRVCPDEREERSRNGRTPESGDCMQKPERRLCRPSADKGHPSVRTVALADPGRPRTEDPRLIARRWRRSPAFGAASLQISAAGLRHRHAA